MPELGLFWFSLAGVRGTHRHMSLYIDSYIYVDIDILRLGLACALPDGSNAAANMGAQGRGHPRIREEWVNVCRAPNPESGPSPQRGHPETMYRGGGSVTGWLPGPLPAEAAAEE